MWPSKLLMKIDESKDTIITLEQLLRQQVHYAEAANDATNTPQT